MSESKTFIFEGETFTNVEKKYERKEMTVYELALDNLDQCDKIFKIFFGFHKILVLFLCSIASFLAIKITLTTVPSDGKCFFHAIHYALEDSIQESSTEMLERSLNHVYDNPINGIPYIFEPTCPDSEELAIATSLLYNINIIIINLDTIKPIVYINDDAIDSIFLFNMNGHYWLVNINFIPNIDIRFDSYANLKRLLHLKIAKHLYAKQMC
jgi:hypothetical protein